MSNRVDAQLTGAIRQSWDTGGIIDMRIDAFRAVNDWEVVVDVGGVIINLWNAQVVGRSGTVYRLGPLDYNAQIEAGGAITLGLQVDGGIAFEPLALEFVGGTAAVPDPATAPPPPSPPEIPKDQFVEPSRFEEPELPRGTGLTGNVERFGAEPGRLIDESPFSDIAIDVSDETVSEPQGVNRFEKNTIAPGPLSTRGAAIIDSNGDPVKIHGINWFGLETEIFVPHGLWARNWRAIMDDTRDLGFNLLRVPISAELVRSGGVDISGVDYSLNPDLIGLTGMEVLDAVLDYADRLGLRVLLDYHRGPPGGGPNDNGLWFGDGGFTEDDVITTWQVLAERYGDHPAVIGADLVNEPHSGTWGDGSETDWARAAERIGAAVQEVAPEWLIVVEGIGEYNGDPYWWGGNLQGVADRPIELPLPNKLVYSPHDYPASVFAQPWFFDGTDLVSMFQKNWGFIAEEGIAPLLIGEWGSRLQTPEDLRWADALSAYLADNDIQWIWWSLNPNSGDTGGIFQDDWRTVNEEAFSLLQPFLEETRSPVTLIAAGEESGSVTFDVTLSAPSPEQLVVKYATTDGTAEAAKDYVASTGTILFLPGETQKSVSVPLLPDSEIEGDEFFYLVIGGEGTLRGSGTAVIVDEARRTTPQQTATQPFVDVASSVAGEGASAARFRIVLSEPAQQDIDIDFVVTQELDALGTVPAAQGSVTIPAGGRDAAVEVNFSAEEEFVDPRRFSLELTTADGAQIRTASASALVTRDAPNAAEFAVSNVATAETQLTIDLIMENDWGSGALYNVVITNVSHDSVGAWQLSIDLPFDLSELWSAVLVADEGDRVTVANAGWNGTIEPGQSAEFGFISDVGGVDLTSLLAGADIELVIQ